MESERTMPCEFWKSPDGQIVGVICSRGPKRQKCYICSRLSSSLCDYPVGNGKTCDKPMCSQCKTTIGPDLDVCREHNNPDDIAKTRGER